MHKRDLGEKLSDQTEGVVTNPPLSPAERPFQIVAFTANKVRMKCDKHGWVGVQPAYDPTLKTMTAISCAKCPTHHPPAQL